MDGLPPKGPVKWGEHTAAKFAETEPDLAAKVVELFDGGHGLSMLAISKLTGIPRNTIAAHLSNKGILGVEQLRQHVGKSCLQATAHLVDRVLENPDSIPASALGVTAKMLGDMGSVMTGNATSRIEHQHTISVNPDKFLSGLDELRRNAALRMHSVTGEIPPISPPTAALEIDAEIVPKTDLVAVEHPLNPVESSTEP